MKIKDISNKKDGKTYKISGIVSNVKEIPVKVDPTKKLIMFDIDDNTGSINAVIFPKNYQAYKDIIKNNIKIKIKGTIKQSEDSTTIIVKSCEIQE